MMIGDGDDDEDEYGDFLHRISSSIFIHITPAVQCI
jgi:hypothetical protein